MKQEKMKNDIWNLEKYRFIEELMEDVTAKIAELVTL